jgi:microcystin-dependent protein
MSTPYVGEIRIFAGNFAPNGWMFCEGQTLPISENEVLFQLIGTTYGGDGQETFNLPNLASRFPMHMGTGPDGTTYQIGEQAGVESVTLTTQQIPNHNHLATAATTGGNVSTPSISTILSDEGQSVANATKIYAAYDNTKQVTLHNSTVGPTGGSQPHDNMHPYLCVNFIISLFGIYPSQT